MEPELTESPEPASDVTFVAVIPAYDCAGSIDSVVADARQYVDTVVVVDDGSRDQTSTIASRAGATILRNPRNLGKGASLRRALAWARGTYTHVVTMDGDGQHLASQLPVVMAAARSSPKAITIGQRIIDAEVVSPNKLFGNRFANRWVEIACDERIPDTQSGFRIYPVEVTLDLGTRADRFAFETEVLIRAVHAGLCIQSVPVDVYYPPANERTSHYRPFVDTVRIIFVVLGLIFRLYPPRKPG